MRKHRRVLFILVDLLAAADLWCQTVVLDDALRDMDVVLTLPQNIEMVPIVKQDDLAYQVAFRITGSSYEVRISLFPRSILARLSSNGDIDRYVPLFSMGLLAAMGKDSMSLSKSAELPGPTVKKEFGADSGMSALIRGNESDFGRGYSHIAVVFLYKSGKGVIVVSFLYNEPRELNMEGLDFSQAYYCFRFNDSMPKK